MRPDLRVISNGASEEQSATITKNASSASQGTVPTGVYALDGTEYYKGTPNSYSNNTTGGDGGNGGGDMTPLWKLDIPRDVQITKWGLAGLAGIILLMFLFILERIDSRFDRADDKITDISNNVSDMRLEVVGTRSDIKIALEKINSNTSTTN